MNYFKGVSKILIFAFSLFSFLAFSEKSIAYDIKQISQNGDRYSIELIASPNTPSNTAQVRLNLQGGMITDFSLPNQSGLLSTGVCSYDEFYTSDSICFDVVSVNGTLETGMSLATIGVQINGSPESFVLSKTSENGYISMDDVFSSDSGSTRPFESNSNINLNSIFIFGILILVSIILIVALVGAFFLTKENSNPDFVPQPSHKPGPNFDYVQFSGVFLFIAAGLSVLTIITFISRNEVQTPEDTSAITTDTLTVCPKDMPGCDFIGLTGIRQAIESAKLNSNISTINLTPGNFELDESFVPDIYLPADGSDIERFVLFNIDLYANGVRNDSHPLTIKGSFDPNSSDEKTIIQGDAYIEGGGKINCQVTQENPCVTGGIKATSGFLVSSGIVNFENLALRGFTYFDAKQHNIPKGSDEYYMSWGVAFQTSASGTSSSENRGPATANLKNIKTDYNTTGARSFGYSRINIENSHFSKNTSNIYISDYVSSEWIRNNHLESSDQNSIYVAGNANIALISMNQITTSQNQSGIALEGKAFVNTIEENSFLENNKNGIDLRSEAQVENIRHNSFVDNENGILWASKPKNPTGQELSAKSQILQNTFSNDLKPSDPARLIDNNVSAIQLINTLTIKDIVGNEISGMKLFGVEVRSSSVENIENNLIHSIKYSETSVGNIATYGTGIGMTLSNGSDKGSFIGSIINNTITNNKYGLLMTGASNASASNKARVQLFKNNIFTHNTFGDGNDKGSGIAVTNNFFTFGTPTFSLFYLNGTGNQHCKALASIQMTLSCQGEGVIFDLDPLYLDFPKNLHLMQPTGVHDGSPGLSSGRTDNNKPTDMGAFGGEYACLLDPELKGCVIPTTIIPTPNPSLTVTPTPNPSPTLTLTPTPKADGTVVCGPADADGDNDFGIYDFTQFARNYYKLCSDVEPGTGNPINEEYGPCGGKDSVREDFEDSEYGIISISDLKSFALRYNKITMGSPDCSL